MNSNPKTPIQNVCSVCEYNTFCKSDYTKHTKTIKHLININQYTQTPTLQQNPLYKCMCGKIYNDNSGLWRHKKKCNQICQESGLLQEPNLENSLHHDNVQLINSQLVQTLLASNNNIKQLIITEQSKNSILISNAPDIHNIALSKSLNVYYKNAIKLDDFLVSLVLRNNIQV